MRGALRIPGGSFPKLLLVHTCFLVFTGLPGVFLNTFLLGRSDDPNVALYYNGMFFFCGAVFMLLAAFAYRRLGAGVSMVIGISCYLLLYLLLILLGDRAADYFLLMGLLSGMADGFYWISYGSLLSSYTDLANRDSGLSVISIAGAVVNLVVPLLSGALISKIGGTKGYVTVFLLAFAVAVATGIGALFLPRPPRDKTPIRYGEAVRLIRRDKRLSASLAGQALKGVREGVFTFILSVLLYQLVKNELLIGFNTFLSAAASILCYWLMNRFLRAGSRVRWMWLAVLVLSGCNLLTALWLAPGSIVLYSVINAFFAGFVVNSAYGIYLDALQVVPGASARRPELIACNECALTAGRLTGIAVMAAVNLLSGGDPVWQCVGLLALTLSQFAAAALCRRSSSLLLQTETSKG